MSNNVLTVFDAAANFTISLASLAANAGRQSTLISNTGLKPAAKISITIKTGAVAPTSGQAYDVFLLRANADSSPTYVTDGAGASDAALTRQNAQLLGSIVVTATSAALFYGDFDTTPLGPLGPKWGILIKNNTGQTADTTEGNFVKTYEYFYPQIQ